MIDDEKDGLLLQLVSHFDETEKIARKYMVHCVYIAQDKRVLDANRKLIDGIKASLKKSSI